MKGKWKMLPALLLFFILGFEMQPVKAEVESSEFILEEDRVTGEYIYARKFIVDGKPAMCIEGTVRIPSVGDVTSDWVEVDNEDLRKVLYYGYGGPRQQDFTFVETVCAAQEANGDGNSETGVRVLKEIVKLDSPPESFRVWKVETRNGSRQDLAFYTTGVDGYLAFKKESANEEITAGDDAFSLAGAVYGVYSDEACTTLMGEFVTDENGESETLTLQEGIYYLKEITAPPGYRLDTEVHQVEVLVDRTVTATVKDAPDVEEVVAETYVLPETGSGTMLFLEIIGFEFLLLSTKKRRK